MSRHGQRRRPMQPWLLPVLTVVGLYWFSASFFLAKRSLPQTSQCGEAKSLLQNTLGLTSQEAERALAASTRDASGCWLDRRVDSVVILVVDALRFDFARYNLPESIGRRLSLDSKNRTTSSQLLQFVADPPTVTMQRLKGLTTGSLPTFADISGNFGGSSIDEDNWVEQLKTVPFTQRGLAHPSRLGFVGDDTWVDLFPTQFDESYPFPSFNTRDLDTVDNGCLSRLPQLLKQLRTLGTRKEELEVVVAHFLGVDHVGHTYGPHNQHMHAKLQQMDRALATTLRQLDDSDRCHVALIFGDHGMTEDGNHGGGSDEEVNAALFVHFSPSCGDMTIDQTPRIGSTFIQEALQSIHQIDLVPTISILLGLPIPFANLGGLVPSLLGLETIQQTTIAMALNAAQVWRYFLVYSEMANKLPNLTELGEQLEAAVAAYKEALSNQDTAPDASIFYHACGLFKLFLVEASELGHRVWTRFDTFGMIGGVVILFFTLLMYVANLCQSTVWPPSWHQWRVHYVEIAITAVFVIFQCGVLTFGNSYIAQEQHIVMFMLTTLGCTVFVRFRGSGGRLSVNQMIPLLIPIASRVGELCLSGHGLDPSIRLHLGHNTVVFVASIAVIAGIRLSVHTHLGRRLLDSFTHCVLDCVAIILLLSSWVEKRNPDTNRNGYDYMRATIAIVLLSLPFAIASSIQCHIVGSNDSRKDTLTLPRDLAVLSKILLFIMAVTGPATAGSVVIFCLQAWAIFRLASAKGTYEVLPPVVGAFWRFLIRHTFFATNHACAFNRLQYSAAFISTMEFNFFLGGLQLFVNTFGWEIVGLFSVWMCSKTCCKLSIWKWYGVYQLIEASFNCISVSILRRHLMVWAVYAPRFLFSAIFQILHATAQALAQVL